MQSILHRYGCGGAFREEDSGAEEVEGDSREMGQEKEVCKGR